jgi:cold shock CspA family protein
MWKITETVPTDKRTAQVSNRTIGFDEGYCLPHEHFNFSSSEEEPDLVSFEKEPVSLSVSNRSIRKSRFDSPSDNIKTGEDKINIKSIFRKIEGSIEEIMDSNDRRAKILNAHSETELCLDDSNDSGGLDLSLSNDQSLLTSNFYMEMMESNSQFQKSIPLSKLNSIFSTHKLKKNFKKSTNLKSGITAYSESSKFADFKFQKSYKDVIPILEEKRSASNDSNNSVNFILKNKRKDSKNLDDAFQVAIVNDNLIEKEININPNIRVDSPYKMQSDFSCNDIEQNQKAHQVYIDCNNLIVSHKMMNDLNTSISIYQTQSPIIDESMATEHPEVVNKVSEEQVKQYFSETIESVIRHGMVKFFDDKNSYGFITFEGSSGSEEIFVHKREFQRAKICIKIVREIKMGAKLSITFQISKYFKKEKENRKAVNLALVQFTPAPDMIDA